MHRPTLSKNLSISDANKIMIARIGIVQLDCSFLSYLQYPGAHASHFFGSMQVEYHLGGVIVCLGSGVFLLHLWDLWDNPLASKSFSNLEHSFWTLPMSPKYLQILKDHSCLLQPWHCFGESVPLRADEVTYDSDSDAKFVYAPCLTKSLHS